MNPLCPTLYSKLQDRFRTVLIANEGEAFRSYPATDLRTGRPQVRVVASGEQYRVSCPRCGDTRHRLYLGHRWADYPWLVYCHNENCYDTPAQRQQLYSYVFHTRRPVSAPARRGRDCPDRAVACRLPGTVIPLDALPPDHPAAAYLAGRGFDPAELARLYGVGFCDRADAGYRAAEGRIIVPVEADGVPVGWQARFVGDRNWKACAVPKYWTMPGLRVKWTLYNLDRARHRAFAVLVEGVTDVWAVGPNAVALFGKSISFHQRRALERTLGGRPLVVMLDGDAQRENDAVTRGLAALLPGGVVRVTLPPGRDPADFSRADLGRMVRLEFDRQGVPFPADEAGGGAAAGG